MMNFKSLQENGLLLSLCLLGSTSFSHATHAQSSALITSGMGGGASSTARLSAIQAHQMNRLYAAESCGSLGQFYGPAFAGDKDAQDCLNDLRITAEGNIGVGTPAPEEKLHVTGNVKIDGTLAASVEAPIENTDIANKEYVDTTIAAAGGGGGRGLVIWGSAGCPTDWTQAYSGRAVAAHIAKSDLDPNAWQTDLSSLICVANTFAFGTGYGPSLVWNDGSGRVKKSLLLGCALCVQ
ncbi:hypothetical protein [Croceicoccus sp. Ery15]|uniref:hypothetical protein n=1 Tax=Croceicoccus sp. Ery15 TaxID=1703338 RepID=UPI001E5ED7A1|nr:hypothetical protein [Croceicoccus sp. Ery15]